MSIVWPEYITEEQRQLLGSFVDHYEDVEHCKVSLSREFPSNRNTIAFEIILPNDRRLFIPHRSDLRIFSIDFLNHSMVFCYDLDD
jgi:hypothetical protein